MIGNSTRLARFCNIKTASANQRRDEAVIGCPPCAHCGPLIRLEPDGTQPHSQGVSLPNVQAELLPL